MRLKVYTDGGSRGNPGEAGIGVYIIDNTRKEIEKRYKHLGIKTNNEAEYLGAYFGIRRAIELGASYIDLYMDSQLVIFQLQGQWKIKKQELRDIYKDIQKLFRGTKVEIKYHWINREENQEADRLSNIAMNMLC